MEVVHVGGAIGIDAGEQWHCVGEFSEIIPGQNDASGCGHGDDMHGVVGGAARGQQADNAIDHGFLVIDLAEAACIDCQVQ